MLYYCCADALRLGNRDRGGINDLPIAGLQSLGAQELFKPFKQFGNHARLKELFKEAHSGSGIWNGIYHCKTDQTLKSESDAHLEFQLLIAEVE